ncbi:Gryzun, putative trafficking through golgi-domain-containing protein [Tuber brumale]|nr:Gryzun, putative trafficking through golgi-domain-containing protein [Tuber brumale]
MDAYPTEFITHETPLLILSGLGEPETEAPVYPLLEEGGFKISSELPPVTTSAGAQLLECFQRLDASSGVWAGRTERLAKSPAFRIRAVGRNYTLPPRKAAPPASGGSALGAEIPPTRALHSPISPLSPDSPLYPDGVISNLWLRKHQLLLPSVFVCFHELFTESNDGNIQNLRDNELIASINAAKKHFSPTTGSTISASIGGDEIRSSGYRSKFAVVLMSDKSILPSSRFDDRVGYIKRSTNLIANATFFFVPADSSAVELQQFALNFLSTLYPLAIEYYRDLSKHSRRKRNKGSVPPPTIPSSRALSQQAWNLRYEFKLGIFAEFRQEMDVAVRNYETAYERLLTEVFETTSSWSDRWTQARLLADITILRLIRCHLWGEQYTAAKRRWSAHVTHMTNILNRKGRGTETYGFAAWMSRWNKCLGELIQSGSLPVFNVSVPASPRMPMLRVGTDGIEPPAIHAPPEKQISVSERIGPQDLLHHAGFYYLKAAELLSVRVTRAKRISISDSVDSYDLYLCPPPQEESTADHNSSQLSLLSLARREFDSRQQKRMVDSITLQITKLKIAKAPHDESLWGEALKDLRSVARIYRKEGWWEVLEDVLWNIVQCGRNAGEGGSVVIAELELTCSSVFKERRGWRYDLSRSLEGVETVKVKPTLVVRGGDVVSFLTASYSFENPSVHAGDSIVSQLVISSDAHASAAPIVFSELKISYEGNLRTILLRHTPSSPRPDSKINKINLKGKVQEQNHSPDEPLPSPTSIKSFLVANTDLSLAPGETKIYEFSSILREAGDAKAICATFVMYTEGFELDYMVMLDTEYDDDDRVDAPSTRAVHQITRKLTHTTPSGANGVWWAGEEGGPLKKKPLRAKEPGTLAIMPRPPKMEVTAKSAIEGELYINETVKIELAVENGEGEDAIVDIGLRILGWPVDDDRELHISQIFHAIPLGKLSPSTPPTKRTICFPSPSIPADCAIEITVHYHLISDPDTHIHKSVMAEMPIINPFSTTFDFSPRIHPDPWPDYFSLEEGTGWENGKRVLGIIQQWCLTVTLYTTGGGVVVVENWELPIHAVESGGDGSVCRVIPDEDSKEPLLLDKVKPTPLPFTLDIQKRSLEDRSAASIDVTLVLHWRRDPLPSAPLNTTTLAVPRLPIPPSEPRVLAAVIQPSPTLTQPLPPNVITIRYTLENPTNYFLTFNVLMEANEAFAFSGPKQILVQLLPSSRADIEYRLFVFPVPREKDVRSEGEEGGRWIKPGLRVVDRYFNKILRVSPGSEGVGLRKAGLVVWFKEAE